MNARRLLFVSFVISVVDDVDGVDDGVDVGFVEKASIMDVEMPRRRIVMSDSLSLRENIVVLTTRCG